MATVIESMTGISVSSPFFSNSPKLQLFPISPDSLKNPSSPKKNRISLLFGQNGSGKSTIAQGFREYVNSPNIHSVNLLPLTGSSYIKVSSESKPEKFFVFDETYIDENIKIQKSGLNVIVLFGEQVQLEQQIQEITKSIQHSQHQFDVQTAECSKYTDTNDVNAPLHWNAKITHKLQAPGKWAEIAGTRIKGNKTNSRVTEAEINRIGQLKPRHDVAATKAEFDKNFILFSNTNSKSQQFNLPIISIRFDKNIESNTASLFAKVIDKPSLSKREGELLQLFGIDTITSAKGFLTVNTNSICPTCLQPITDRYRDEVLSEIEEILNREVEEFTSSLRKLMQQEIKVDTYQQYSLLNSEALGNVEERLSILNNAIDAHNKAIQAKIDKPFEPMKYDSSIGLTAAYVALNQALACLEAERVSYNNMITSRKAAETELLLLNDELAHFDIQDEYISLIAQKKAKKIADDKRDAFQAEIETLNRKKTDLDSKRKNIKIAAEEINRSLEYIFFCKGRLELELGKDQVYHLKSYGQPVNPNKISCGERNALALCYFFTQIAQNMDAHDLYANEVFLVIDDPISSFDLENRIGILSFLRLKLNQVLVECATSKVLVMTHDISVMFDLQKAMEEISKNCEHRGCNAEYRLFQLTEKTLEPFSYRNHNEYTQMLNEIYDYAKNPTDDLDLVIGNMMRRVLEAFSSFSFKKNIVEVSQDTAVLGLLPDEQWRIYFKNLMYRLVLNNESHFLENVQGAPETTFFSHLSTAEKQRTAKDILCFMYKLNEIHIRAHLPNAQKDLENWCTNISEL